jgi:hypothetical protein
MPFYGTRGTGGGHRAAQAGAHLGTHQVSLGNAPVAYERLQAGKLRTGRDTAAA